MAIYTVPSRQVNVETHIRDSLSTLDVVWATKFENENISPEEANEAEAEFYKGAPPKWLNFYWAEKEGSPFVRRDLYEELRKKINENTQKSWSLIHTDVSHHPGSGGSTLAMQLLWDLRGKLRCARVIDSATDTKAVAKQVVDLFEVGGPENQNTVLLLLDNKCRSDDIKFKKYLEEDLIFEIQSKNIQATVPVVIILNCIRQSTEREVMLCRSLSESETHKFKKMHADVIQRHGDRHTEFHAFNIMVRKKQPSDVKEICEILHPFLEERPCKAQLLECLALVNSYAPSSYLTLDLCRQFLYKENSPDSFSLEKEMDALTNILVIFSTQDGENGSEEKRVRMAHPMIADECLQLLTSKGVKRSEITKTLLTDFCRDGEPLYMERTIHRILTKREKTQKQESMDKSGRQDMDKSGRQDKDKAASKAKFSRLIQDITTEESKEMCTSVLHMASEKFPKKPIVPQALARFYYTEMTDYSSAENWAKTAIEKDKDNSVVSDTLAQVHKNHLKHLVRNKSSLREVLQIGQKAIEAFENEREAAMKEQSPDTKEPDATSTSFPFNSRGLTGYMEVAGIIFSFLQKYNLEWSEILKKENCEKYTSLLTRLTRQDVETKFEFFVKFLTYSKPSIDEDEPSYFWETYAKTYENYIKQSAQKEKKVLPQLKEKEVSTFAGLLRNALNMELDLKLITEQLRTLHLSAPSDDEAVQKYILANVFLCQRNARSENMGELQSILMKLWNKQKDKRSPEFYLLVLMLFWPDGEQLEDSPDISECVEYMHESFEQEHLKFYHSRYLVPLFLLGAERGVRNLVCASQLEKDHIDLVNKGEEAAEIPNLLRTQGVVRCYKVFAVNGSKEIKVSAQCPASIRHDGKVSFYLGFTIKGPAAYNIRYEK